jgi:hypothetical protein
MTSAIKFRSVVLALGVLGVTVSLSTFVASYFRHVDTAAYLKQADQGVPWVRFGLASSAAGLVFCLFGQKWRRVAGVALALALFAAWMVIGESLY